MMSTPPQPPAPVASEPWWPAFFDDDYAAYGLASTPPEQIERIVGFVIRALELEPAQTVFDQCCGIGRLSLPLAERGLDVIGVELMPSYVEIARRAAEERGVRCEFYQDDASRFVAPRPCDAAINWFTSFGYTPEDDRNIQMLQRTFESLKPGGRFLLDYQNIPRILADFRASFVDRAVAPALQGLLVVCENRLDLADGMNDSRWTFLYPDGRRVERRVQTRLYMPHELVGMLKRCGFEGIDLLGSADGEPFARDSRRCIVLARKPPKP